MQKSIPILVIIALNHVSLSSGKRGNCPANSYVCKQDGNINCQQLLLADGELEPSNAVNCRVNCEHNHYWCEKRGICISDREVCDCGVGSIMCVHEDKYLCAERKNILDSEVVSICADGTCKTKGSCNNEYAECSEGTFKCGDECKRKDEITNFRSCSGKCIPSHQLCFKDDSVSGKAECSTVDGLKCIFPFTFENTTYNYCPINVESKPWCSTVVDKQTGEHVVDNFGICAENCPLAPGIHEISGDAYVPSGLTIGLSFLGVFLLFTLFFLLHAAQTCRRYKAIQERDRNVRDEDGACCWCLENTNLYLSGNMMYKIEDDIQLRRASVEANPMYGFGEDEEENEITDYNDYYT